MRKVAAVEGQTFGILEEAIGEYASGSGDDWRLHSQAWLCHKSVYGR